MSSSTTVKANASRSLLFRRNRVRQVRWKLRFSAKKGQEVIIEGQLRRNDWESEDGQKHSKHFLRAENWQFTQYRRQEESTEVAPEKEIKETKKTA